jgi:hypothetical protein
LAARGLDYGFDTIEDEFGVVADASDFGNDSTVGAVSAGLGPPTWGAAFGITGGGYSFTGSSTAADYMQSLTLAGISGNTSGSVSLWFNLSSFGNQVSIPFCVSNGFESSKSEIAISLDRSAGELVVRCHAIVDGATKWEVESSKSSILVGEWMNVVLVHDGVAPKIYINGTEDTASFLEFANKKIWMNDITSATNSADRIVVGGAPRVFSPLIALGFSGFLDEVIVWNTPLSALDISDAYGSMESFSSSTSSST